MVRYISKESKGTSVKNYELHLCRMKLHSVNRNAAIVPTIAIVLDCWRMLPLSDLSTPVASEYKPFVSESGYNSVFRTLPKVDGECSDPANTISFPLPPVTLISQ